MNPTFREETVARARQRLAEIREEAREILWLMETLGEYSEEHLDGERITLEEFKLAPASEIDVDYDKVENTDGEFPTVEEVRDWIVRHRGEYFSMPLIARAFGWKTKVNKGTRHHKHFSSIMETLAKADVIVIDVTRRRNLPKWRYNEALPAGPTEHPRGPGLLGYANGGSAPVAGTGRGGTGQVRGQKWLREVRDQCKPGTMFTTKPNGHYEFRLGRKVVHCSGTPTNEHNAQREVLRDLAAKGMLR